MPGISLGDEFIPFSDEVISLGVVLQNTIHKGMHNPSLAENVGRNASSTTPRLLLGSILRSAILSKNKTKNKNTNYPFFAVKVL